MAYNSKYTGQEVENLLDQIAKGNTGGGGITSESDPIFSASPAASITEANKTEWNNKQDAISDLEAIRSGASKGATAVQSSALSSVATSGDYSDLRNKPTIPTKLSDLSNGNILTCEFMGEVGDVIWSDDDQDRIDYIANWMEALSLGKVCVLDFDDYEGTYAMVHAINYRNDATYGIGKVIFSYVFEGYLYDVEYESVSLPVTLTIVNKTKIGGEGGSNTDGGVEPMVCAYRILTASPTHIELENYTYNGQTMNYREGAIILITNPLGEDVVFEGGTLTLDGNEYEADAFTLKVGATTLFTLGVDSGILFPISSVVGATTTYVDQAIANAITNTLNTPV